MEVAAYSTVAMTLGLVVARPRVGEHHRISPALAASLGVAIMILLGIVGLEQIRLAALNLWSPFVAIAAIMVMTEVAERVGLLELWSSWVDTRAESCEQLFTLVFCLGIATSSALNNDAAILLLTPLVIALVRRRYPDRPELLVPFAFAVFTSAGVAALPVSNPMNMVVAEFSDIGINTYAMHMIPVAVACWAIGYFVLRRLFRSVLIAVPRSKGPENRQRRAATVAQRLMMALLLGALVSYPVVGVLGGPVWAVPFCGALMALVLARRHGGADPVSVVAGGVSWGILAFLFGVLVLSMGLLEVGVVDRLGALYADADAGIGTIGITSAAGSALLNNHPMSHLNMMALEGAGASEIGVLAALVGGDLGPRLLPMGSLAGLLWLELLRRHGVEVSLRRFMTVGVLLTVPTLAVALSMLYLF